MVAVGVAACDVAIPTPSRSAAARPPGVASAAPASPVPAPASPPAAASREPAGDLGRELEVFALDTAWTEPTLEFASDGESIIFSSGVADGPDVEFAPDLWRYVPGADAPELLWHNPSRDRSLTRIGGEFGTWAFVDMPVSGEIAWDFWLLPGAGSEPILLDSHPGDPELPDWVPSFSVRQDGVAWTSFDHGPDGSVVSRLLFAGGPDWEPIVVVERDAARSELWLPSLRDRQIAYTEIVYSLDRSTDARHVYFVDTATPEVEPRRLDTSGRAAMPLLMINGGIAWKEADPGFSMFNWGRMFLYDEGTGEVASLPVRPQDYVNYPSAGDRFIAWWGADSTAFGVYDRELATARLIDRWPPETNVHILRPHVGWDLLVWLHAEFDGLGNGPDPQIRYALLPGAGTSRDTD
jgi:hypothetical protein